MRCPLVVVLSDESLRFEEELCDAEIEKTVVDWLEVSGSSKSNRRPGERPEE